MGLAMCTERWGWQVNSQLQEPFVGKMERKDSICLSWGKLHLSLVLLSWNKVMWAWGNMKLFSRVVEHQTFGVLCPLSPDNLHKSQLGTGSQGCQPSFDEVQPQSLTTQVLWSLQEMRKYPVTLVPWGSILKTQSCCHTASPSLSPATQLCYSDFTLCLRIWPWQDCGCRRRIRG